MRVVVECCVVLEASIHRRSAAIPERSPTPLHYPLASLRVNLRGEFTKTARAFTASRSLDLPRLGLVGTCVNAYNIKRLPFKNYRFGSGSMSPFREKSRFNRPKVRIVNPQIKLHG